MRLLLFAFAFCGSQPAGDGGLTADQSLSDVLNPCRSWLASDDGLSVNINIECTCSVCGKTESGQTTWNPVGASLLAMAVGQPTSLLNVPASSRAGSLPQLDRVHL